MTTWRKLILINMLRGEDTWDDVVSVTLSDKDLDEVFDCSFGTAEGKPFTLWTESRVYFPTEYDGSEGCASVSRLVDGKPTEHIG